MLAVFRRHGVGHLGSIDPAIQITVQGNVDPFIIRIQKSAVLSAFQCLDDIGIIVCVFIDIDFILICVDLIIRIGRQRRRQHKDQCDNRN